MTAYFLGLFFGWLSAGCFAMALTVHLRARAAALERDLQRTKIDLQMSESTLDYLRFRLSLCQKGITPCSES